MSRSTDQRVADILEATKHLPAELTDAHPEIAWPQIRCFRNVLVHHYFGVYVAASLDVVETYLPAFAPAPRGAISRP